MGAKTESAWDVIRDRAGPYPPEAFCFVQEGLRATVDRLASNQSSDLEGERHVTGQQLCLGLRDFAIDQYGLLAKAVLESWRIRRTEDFGRIVFILVEAGMMRKTEEDSIGDFTEVYDFEEVFGRRLERC